MGRLAGKVAIVTGAASGIGRAMTLGLLGAGVDVAAVDRNEAGLAALAATVHDRPGALQSIPEELTEAATVDGARPWAVFRLIKLPLLLVTVAPLLIASFAFNFNNFIVIYALTNGGPRDINAPIPVGHTDILISMVYKVAFTGQNRDYGLAAASSILIYIMLAVIAIVLFRRTKALEDLN